MIAGVVLAAGRSSRLGRPKQLLPLQGEPLIRSTLRRVLASSLDEVVVVVGHEAAAVSAAITDLPVRIVQNPDAARGQSTSLVAGLRALPPEADAAMVLLADQPGIDPAVVDTLVSVWRETGAPVVAPSYTDGLGNPVIFDHRLFADLLALEGDAGARRLVRAHRAAGDLRVVPVAGPAPPDVDTEEDYAALLASFTRRSDEAG